MVKHCDGSIMLQGCFSLKRHGERRDWNWGFSHDRGQDISQDVMDRSKYQSILTQKQKSVRQLRMKKYCTIMKQSPNASQQRNGFRRRSRLSLDLNLIEHLWNKLKRAVHTRSPCYLRDRVKYFSTKVVVLSTEVFTQKYWGVVLVKGFARLCNQVIVFIFLFHLNFVGCYITLKVELKNWSAFRFLHHKNLTGVDFL